MSSQHVIVCNCYRRARKALQAGTTGKPAVPLYISANLMKAAECQASVLPSSQGTQLLHVLQTKRLTSKHASMKFMTSGGNGLHDQLRLESCKS